MGPPGRDVEARHVVDVPTKLRKPLFHFNQRGGSDPRHEAGNEFACRRRDGVTLTRLRTVRFPDRFKFSG
jgi:hypothetical protein